jgi:hypothetical protein
MAPPGEVDGVARAFWTLLRTPAVRDGTQNGEGEGAEGEGEESLRPRHTRSVA